MKTDELPHRCNATTKFGDRCRRFAVWPAELCPFHLWYLAKKSTR